MLTEKQLENFFKIPVSKSSDRNAKLLFSDPENVRGLLKIVAAELVEYIDFSRIIAVNRSYIAETLREVESDIVFRVPFQMDTRTDELLIYILIEHQSTVDPIMEFRVLYYMCQIWDAERRQLDTSKVPRSQWRLCPILPIIYYTGEQRWEMPLPLTDLIDAPEVFSRFIPKFDTLFLNVKDTNTTDLSNMDHPFSWLLTVLQQDTADEATLRKALLTTLSRFDSLEPSHAAQHRNALLFLCHLILFRRPEEERADLMRLVQEHTDDVEVKNMIKSAAETLIEQGIEQGKIQEKHDSLIRLLQRRIGNVSETVINQIRTIQNASDLDDLFDQAAEANSLNDVDIPNDE